MDGMLNALLDINRLEAGAITPQRSDFPLASLLARMLSDFSYAAELKGLQLRIVPSKAMLHSDPELLAEIVRNLVGNAIKYTERGRVLIGCRRRGDKLRIEVWDSGPRIAEDRLRQIFEEFYQIGNSERDRRRGLGLGLAIVERLSRLLDHSIDVQSKPGKGSLFAVEVPRGKALPQACPVTKVAPASTDAAATGSILYIEDDPAIRDAMQILLELEGFRVTTAGDGREALAEVNDKGLNPDLILSDFRLPAGETGTEVVKNLHRLLGNHIPAVIITGDISDEQREQAEQAGCRLLLKPVDDVLLMQTLRESVSA